MELWALVYQEHYEKYLTKNILQDDLDSLQQYMKDIGTPAISFQRPGKRESNYVAYKQVPQGSCIRLRRSEDYVSVIHNVLYPELQQERRSSSCIIV